MTTLPRPGSSGSVSFPRRATALTGVGAAVILAALAAPARAEPSFHWWRAPAEIAMPCDVPSAPRIAVDEAAIDFVLAPPRGAACARVASAARASLLRQVTALAGRLGGTTIVAASPSALVRKAAIARRSLRAEHVLRTASAHPTEPAASAAPAPAPARERAGSDALPAAMARREPGLARVEHTSNRLISGAALAFLVLVLLVPATCSVAATAAAGPTRAPPKPSAARARASAVPLEIAPRLPCAG
jgi:hypothetical protein